LVGSWNSHTHPPTTHQRVCVARVPIYLLPSIPILLGVFSPLHLMCIVYISLSLSLSLVNSQTLTHLEASNSHL
jgi:hypothetical protein